MNNEKKDFEGYEKEVNTRITLTEYHDLSHISDFNEEQEVNKLGHELTDVLNKYQDLTGIDKIQLMKNITLQLIDQGVRDYLLYKKDIEIKKMQEENK